MVELKVHVMLKYSRKNNLTYNINIYDLWVLQNWLVFVIKYLQHIADYVALWRQYAVIELYFNLECADKEL